MQCSLVLHFLCDSSSRTLINQGPHYILTIWMTIWYVKAGALAHRFWNNHSDKIWKDIQCDITTPREEGEQLPDSSIGAPVETKGMEKNAIPLGTLLLCCSLNLHSLKCLAAELVDTEVPPDAYEANKFDCQPGAESLYGRSNEPGENVKQGKMKQTLWSISCSTLWISNSSSEPQWKIWLTSGGRGQNSTREKRWGMR